MRAALSFASSSAACALARSPSVCVTVCLKKNRIDLRDGIARFHLGIKIGKQLLDVARNLAADLHVHDRIQCPGSGDGLSYRAPRHRHSLIIWSPRPPHRRNPKIASNNSCDDRKYENDSLRGHRGASIMTVRTLMGYNKRAKHLRHHCDRITYSVRGPQLTS